ncbi:DNA recombination protein RmuC [Roseateles sp.]|uniref:DNA recombination protein RmuC n=1 Tax=Roseateles sp. TaxID=1971397 RepID=UPI0025FD7822|nr:DNA recombination protein RmuC [Roseateles sp.]MBV8035214.1 DNA recombination protein RmuC [Roseateles sp.]
MSLPELMTPVLLVLILVLLVLVWVRQKPQSGVPPELLQSNERLERELRDELGRSASGTRQELVQGLAQFQQVLTQGLQGSNQSLAQQALAAREAQDAAALRSVQAQAESMQRLNDAMRDQLQALSKTNDQRLAELRLTVEQRLTSIQQDNEKKLEQMRATVDEKLHATLEQRLGESFKQVAERLEQVHKGLGEMQNLARDVGSLNRVLTNVKTRGVFGEVQLAGLLDQVFTPEQYAANVATLPGSSERVEFAISLPGQRDDGKPLWLPIDAKFPREDYERLLDAQERGDPAAAEASAKAIESRLRLEARTIREKYIGPPHTTDFAILFVPTEGLYAEALRRPGLVEGLQREHKVMLCGPTTLLATLTSLQMGFRTLALEKRSAEVWEVLGAVKTEFGKFGDVLAKAKKKLEEAGNTLDAAEVRTRAMTRKLKGVEALPDDAAQQLLQLGAADEGGD